MRTRTQLAIGVLLAAVLPLAAAAASSIIAARSTARAAVTDGMRNTALQAAGRIESFFSTQRRILTALSETVASTSHLDERQTEAVLRNHVLDFAAFHELAIYGRDGGVKLAVRRGAARDLPDEPRLAARAIAGEVALGRYYIGEDLQPGVALAVPVHGLDEIEGALVAQVELVELWRLVDAIRIGEQGYALITDAEGRLLAGGVGELKARALLAERASPDAGLPALFAAGKPHAGTRAGAVAGEVLAAEVPLPGLGLLVAVEAPTAEAFAGATDLARTLGLVALLAALGALGVAFLAARRPLRKIAGLAAAMERVAQGDFGARAFARGDDELASLARDFNRMAGRLRELTGEVRRHERMSVFARIAAGLAHDLKHPIKNLENQARLVHELADDPAFRKQFHRTVEREFATLDQFLTNLADLTGQLDFTPVALDPRRLAELAVDGVSGQAAAKQVQLAVRVPEGIPRLLGDRITLERALKNLLVNAVEASPAGAEVRVEAEVEDTAVSLLVVDGGPGIPPERLASLFEEFSTTKRSGKGLGLGLALTSRFVGEQGGRVECRSTPGQGATFRIRMPRAPAEEAAAA